MLSLKGVSKAYQRQQKRAVDSLDPRSSRGKSFVSQDPTGPGKTTTIKMIVGLLRPDEGRITVNGIDVVLDPIGAKEQIGYVPDTAVLYERLTGIEFLQLVADVRRIDPSVRTRRVQELAEILSSRTRFPISSKVTRTVCAKSLP